MYHNEITAPGTIRLKAIDGENIYRSSTIRQGGRQGVRCLAQQVDLE